MLPELVYQVFKSPLNMENYASYNAYGTSNTTCLKKFKDKFTQKVYEIITDEVLKNVEFYKQKLSNYESHGIIIKKGVTRKAGFNGVSKTETSSNDILLNLAEKYNSGTNIDFIKNKLYSRKLMFSRKDKMFLVFKSKNMTITESKTSQHYHQRNPSKSPMRSRSKTPTKSFIENGNTSRSKSPLTTNLNLSSKRINLQHSNRSNINIADKENIYTANEIKISDEEKLEFAFGIKDVKLTQTCKKILSLQLNLPMDDAFFDTVHKQKVMMNCPYYALRVSLPNFSEFDIIVDQIEE